MSKEMLINVSEGEECRIALLDNGKLEELYMERTSSTSHVGNIYKGRVTNVEPSIQAAFVDFGLGRNGFLHISDLMPTYFGRAGSDIQESVGKKMARRDRPPIQRCLRRGDEIIVQIIKEGIGTKGPTLSTYLSIPGRILVMMPGMGKMGVSKKIEDEEERRRLRTILDSLKPPKGVGFIIRTAGIGKSKAEIQRDLTYLSRLWQQIEKKRTSGSGPMELYTEGDLVARTVRDVYSNDVERLVVDNKEVAKRVKEVIKITSPRTKNKLEVFEGPIPLFHKYGIEKDIEMMYSRHVPLPSGGSLVIDSTEAIVAIDVNSGKFRDHSDAEMTAFKTDMEAAEEIPRQLKLRDLGGVIICDFIDLRYERHRRELEEKLHENFKKDRAKTKVLRMSQFGIIEITRQRMRPSLKRSIYFDCPHCKGAGLVKTPESMSLDVMRKLAIAAHSEKVARIEMSVCPDVGFYLLNKKRSSLSNLEAESKRKIVVRTEPALGLDEIKLDLFDARDGLVFIEELGLTMQPPHTSQLNTRAPGQKGRDRGGRGGERRHGGGQPHGGRGGRGGQRQLPPPRREEELELEEAEEAIEAREVHRERTPADEALIASIAPKVVRGQDDDADDEIADAPAPIESDAAEAPAAEGEIVDDDIEEDEEEEIDSNVVDVDDGPSELGDRPAGEWDRPGYRGAGGGAGGGGGAGHQGNRDRDREGGGGGRRRRRRRRGRGGGGAGGEGIDQQQQPRQPQAGSNQQGPPRAPQPQHQQPRPQGGGGGGGGGGHRDQRHQGGGRDQRQGGGRDQRQGGGGRRDKRFRDRGPKREVFGVAPPGQPSLAEQLAGEGNRYADEEDFIPLPVKLPPKQPPAATGGAPSVGGGFGPQQGGGGAVGGAAAGQEGGGRRRRRRRGGRRHRRRRERERLEQLKAMGLVPPDATEIPPELRNMPLPGGPDRGDERSAPQGAGAAAADDYGDEDEDDYEDDETAATPEAERALEPAPQPVEEAPPPAPVVEEAPAEVEVAPAEADEAREAPRKRTRKAASTGKTKPTKTKATKSPGSKSKTTARRTPKRTPPAKSAASEASSSKAFTVADETPVVKTGSTDKHLADDEPVEHAPVSRPRRRYDLDAIPDDFD